MLLSAGSASEFLKVVQIVSWIVLPVLATVVAFTIYSHYRRKKKNRASALSADGALPAPATLAQLGKGADYVLFDHSGLVQQYHEKLCHSQAMYAALQHKFSALEIKCTAMAAFVLKQPGRIRDLTGYPFVKREINQFIRKYHAEKKDWQSANLQLSASCLDLQKENEQLKAQLASLATEASISVVGADAREAMSA
jgi:phosphate/sulfate permease